MATHVQLIQAGNLEGLLYGFDKRGEGLMMHTHEADTAHDIQVMRGAVKVYGEVPTTIVLQDEHFNFDWSKPHEVVALEDNTVIFNRFLHGIPKPFRDLPVNRRSGTFDDTLHHPIPYDFALR